MINAWAAFFAGAGLMAVALFWAAHLGQRAGTAKHVEKILNDIQEAKEIRQRLDHDPGFARRLRKRFTR